MSGIAVPFHIHSTKNISQCAEGDYMYLRVKFLRPGAAMGLHEGRSYHQPDAAFVKEIT
jgi:nucleosome binding factor SPN SPT16 subunit